MTPHQLEKTDLRLALADRRWHSGIELVDHFLGLIPPEHAAQVYWADKDPVEGVPEETVIRDGIGKMIIKGFCHLINQGAVDSRGQRGINRRQFRWVEWHCQLCGAMVAHCPTIPRHGLCPQCVQSLGNGFSGGDDAKLNELDS